MIPILDPDEWEVFLAPEDESEEKMYDMSWKPKWKEYRDGKSV